MTKEMHQVTRRLNQTQWNEYRHVQILTLIIIISDQCVNVNCQVKGQGSLNYSVCYQNSDAIFPMKPVWPLPRERTAATSVLAHNSAIIHVISLGRMYQNSTTQDHEQFEHCCPIT